MKLFLSLENNTDNRDLASVLNDLPQYEVTDHFDQDEKTAVIVNGPLTQLADMLLKDHTLSEKISEIILVGGTDSYGDVTPLAERNIYRDPKSAQHVFLSGIPIIMFGLNVTRNLEDKAMLPLIWLEKTDIFKTKECGVFVETKGRKTRGMTVTDLYSDKQFDHHYVKMVTDIDIPALKKVLKDLNCDF